MKINNAAFPLVPCPLVFPLASQLEELGVNTDLVKLLDAIAPVKVVVIGEAMLDCYLAGFSDRMSQKQPYQ